jgi:copper transport protein
MLVLALAFVLVPAGRASAHAGFVSSEPEPGSTLGTAPGVVVLSFTEPLNADLSRASVVPPDGAAVDGRVTGGREMRVTLTTNSQGVYEVRWRTVSVIDGHTLSGSFRFGVGVSPGPGAEGETRTGPSRADLLLAGARLFEDLALLLAIGLVLLGRLARREPALEWVRTGPSVPLAVALVAGATVVLGEALIAAPTPSAGAVATYLTTGQPGVARLARPLLEAAALTAALRGRRPWLPLGAAVLALAAAGHAAAVRPRWWGVGVEWTHLLSAGAWAGGVLALALQRPPGGWLGAEARPLLDRFTPPALLAFGVTAATGSLRGLQELGALGRLIDSSYGNVLLIKVLLVVAMIQLSLIAWRRVAVAPRFEATVAVAAVGAAALLAAYPLPPARTTEAERAQARPAAASAIPVGGELTFGADAGQVLVGLTIRPAAPGPNELLVYVLGPDGPDATAALPVDVDVDGAPLEVDACGPTCRSASAELSGGELVQVLVGTPVGGTAAFDVPQLPAAEGSGILARSLATMGSLTSYRQDETLSAGLGVVRATYAFVAPDAFESTVLQGGARVRTIWVGTTRYLSRDGGPWEIDVGGSPRVPSFTWDTFSPYVDVRVVGASTVEGIRSSEVVFFGGDESLPVWFRLWVGEDGLVRRAEMHAPGHFMDHRYYAFDEPITIEPPEGASP